MANIAQTMSRRNLYGRPIISVLYTGATNSGSSGEYLTNSVISHGSKIGNQPVWGSKTGESGLAYPKNGYIQGVVQVSGTVVPNIVVRLYRDIFADCLAEMQTTSVGGFYFGDLNPNLSDYYVVYLAPNSGTVYNHRVTAKLIPST